MSGRIQRELKQNRPFKLLEEETVLNIMRTAGVLTQQLTDLLQPFDLSTTQYNVLRILRGAGDAGVTCKDISGRMVTREPDITRLLDRLEKRALITRDRARSDRRFITVRLTGAGLELVNLLDRPVREFHRQAMKHCTGGRQRELIDLLECVRAGDAAP